MNAVPIITDRVVRGLTAVIIASSVIILIESARRAYKVLVKGRYTVRGRVVSSSDPGFKPPEYGET